MTAPENPNGIQMFRRYVRELPAGLRLTAEVSPCVFMYPGYPLQMLVTLKLDSGDSAGFATIADRAIDAKTATEADVIRLLESVRIALCSRCSAPAFDPSTVKTNRNGLCETCFDSDLQAEFAMSQEAELRRIDEQDSEMKASGMKFRVTAWVHPDVGDDHQIDWYLPHRPSPGEIRRHLRKLGSIVLDDWELTTL